jgi:hypothetical protein
MGRARTYKIRARSGYGGGERRVQGFSGEP